MGTHHSWTKLIAVVDGSSKAASVKIPLIAVMHWVTSSDAILSSETLATAIEVVCARV